MRASSLAAGVVILLACGEQPQTQADDRQAHHDSAPSHLATSSYRLLPDSGGHRRYEILNRRFLSTRLYSRSQQGATRPIVLETVTRHCCLDGEADTWGVIRLESVESDIGEPTSPTWSIELAADEGELWGDFYRAVSPGCCDAASALAFVSLWTGQLAFTMTPERGSLGDLPFQIEAPNSSLRRYVVFHDRWTPHDPPEARTADVVGVLQYGTGREPSRRYVVKCASGSGVDYRLVDVQVALNSAGQVWPRQVALWAANGSEDPAALTDFAIRVTLLHLDEDEEVTIQVPVMADTLVVARLQAPRGWTVQSTASMR